MNSLPTYKIIVTEYFKKQLKRLIKKNHSFIETFKKELFNFNKQQTISIGMGVYKMRIKGQIKGKSGGYRMYVFIIETEGVLAPICIYAKNEKENLTYTELTWHLDRTKEELTKLT